MGAGLDTEGVAWSEVTKLKGCEMVPYICPRITKRLYEQCTGGGLFSHRDATAVQGGVLHSRRDRGEIVPGQDHPHLHPARGVTRVRI